MDEARLNAIGKLALDCAFRVHTELGPGLLESSYKACLAYELAKAGSTVQIEVPVPLIYDGQQLATSDIGWTCSLTVRS